ncbi:MAG: aldehyde ferredoxin oxidoreductase family protein [Bacillota bacterium]
MPCGWTGKRLVVDLSSGTVATQPIPEELARAFLGGRGLNIRTLAAMTGPETDPLGPENPILMATGPLTGTDAPGTPRFNVGGRSPLTGILGDANAGGFFGPEMKFAGYDQIVVTGRARGPVYLAIVDGEAEVRDAEAIWGLDTWDTHDAIRKDLKDPAVQVSCIGPAGERLVPIAAIITSYGRAAARTGLAAVMGSKRLKAVAVRGTGPVKVRDGRRWARAVRNALTHLENAPSLPIRARFGTTMLIDLYNRMGLLPTRNNQRGVFSEAADIGCETLEAHYVKGLKACFACPVHCSRYYRVEEGPYAGTHGEGPEFETLAALGSRCGNSDLGSILYLNSLANREGIDTISLGGVLGFVLESLEAGVLTPGDLDGLAPRWGDPGALVELTLKISRREGIGDLLAQGVRRASLQFPGSERYALHVKGLEVPEQEIRGLKAWGLGWAVSSRGADHLRAFPVAETTLTKEEAERLFGASTVTERLRYEGKEMLVKWSEEISAVSDSAEFCKFVTMSMALPVDHIVDLLVAATGREFTPDETMRIGERVVNLERLYNVSLGVTGEADTVPERFLKEPLPDGSAAGEIFDLNAVLQAYYRSRGWDKNGVPYQETARRLDLDSIPWGGTL